MAFVLISSTRGDDLIQSKDSVVATSEDRGELETLRDNRAEERAGWLAKNPVPWWAQCSLIHSEKIQEVPSI